MAQLFAPLAAPPSNRREMGPDWDLVALFPLN